MIIPEKEKLKNGRVYILYPLYSSSSIITNITESGRGQGALNITGYLTDLLDCSVVARYNARTKSEGTVDPRCNLNKFFVRLRCKSTYLYLFR